MNKTAIKHPPLNNLYTLATKREDILGRTRGIWKNRSLSKDLNILRKIKQSWERKFH